MSSVLFWLWLFSITTRLSLHFDTSSICTGNGLHLSGCMDTLRHSGCPFMLHRLSIKQVCRCEITNYLSSTYYQVQCVCVCFERVCGTACVCYLCSGSPVCWQPPRIIVSFFLKNLHIQWDFAVADFCWLSEQDVLSGLLGGPWLFLTVL